MPPSTPTDTLFYTIDTSPIGEEKKAKSQVREVRLAIEEKVRARDGRQSWRCAAVIKDTRNADRIKVVCRDEAEMQLVREVAEKAVVKGTRVIRDQLYPVKVDGTNRTAVLDSSGEVLPGTTEAPNSHRNWIKFCPIKRYAMQWPVRSMLWIRSDLEAEQVPIASADLMGAILCWPDREVLVVLVYVGGKDDYALHTATMHLHTMIANFRNNTGKKTDVVLAGDFNRHDQLWGGDEMTGRR
ncbi:uncharacterized protein BKA55DRAFT_70561 [Fusarium redolens]|uniref:Endonuclease/exonuclease/phosphatase domain-containing protein n=1 Tax=Fusarium redolens TaxID=48865 RepID=A0A9P9K4F3_FUSRE|nr:uncharacterized protein BKA55DRAFT_70561 [Fusarium redolens]KAH7247633.1 hypothetical protein BKA55DRAFT_70561 [Fusarium redolens]